MTAQKQYKALLKRGILLDMYENLTGCWVEDKEVFLKIYEFEQSFINETEIIDEEYE